MHQKSFIITIDTESDNQWDYGREQTTLNAQFIPRFQELCERFSLMPTYLVDYSMGQNQFLVEYLRDRNNSGLCEIGMHLHAWNTPPYHNLDSTPNARPYLIEYPDAIMEEKIKTLNNLLCDQFNTVPVSHRAGRWAMNDIYIEKLSKLGYLIDCSYTPGVNWENTKGAKCGGSDYSKIKNEVIKIGKNKEMIEVPVSLLNLHILNLRGNLPKEIVKAVLGRNVWLRPAINSNYEIMKLLSCLKTDYTEFMMHSSELMPGGSPYFSDGYAIDEMYANLEQLFAVINEKYQGHTLKNYYLRFKNSNKYCEPKRVDK